MVVVKFLEAQQNGEAKKGSMYAVFAAAPLVIMERSSVGLGLVHSTFMNKTFTMHMSLEIYKTKPGNGETPSISLHSKGAASRNKFYCDNCLQLGGHLGGGVW